MAFNRYLLRRANKTGIYFIDSTSISVCKNQRIKKHKVFEGLAQRGKTSMGWFFGFKLHLIINERGELINIQITKGNISDIKPVEKLSNELQGMMFGDKGYLSKELKEKLHLRGLNLVTKIRRDMKNFLIPKQISYFLQKRGIIETVIGYLKDFKSLIHSKARSSTNFFMNIFSSICSYQMEERKPNLGLRLKLEM